MYGVVMTSTDPVAALERANENRADQLAAADWADAQGLHALARKHRRSAAGHLATITRLTRQLTDAVA